MLRFCILLPALYAITSCTFVLASLQQDERLLFSKLISEEHEYSSHQNFGMPIDIITCIEPPLNAPRIRHTAFEICLAYANLAINDQGYKTQLAKAIEMDHSSILAEVAFNAMGKSGISEERADAISRLIYNIYGASIPLLQESE